MANDKQSRQQFSERAQTGSGSAQQGEYQPSQRGQQSGGRALYGNDWDLVGGQHNAPEENGFRRVGKNRGGAKCCGREQPHIGMRQPGCDVSCGDSTQRPVDQRDTEERAERGAPSRSQALLGGRELYQIDELVDERAGRWSATFFQGTTDFSRALDRPLAAIEQRLDRNKVV